MSELKYSGFTVSVACGSIAALVMENLFLFMSGIVVGILYEVMNR